MKQKLSQESQRLKENNSSESKPSLIAENDPFDNDFINELIACTSNPQIIDFTKNIKEPFSDIKNGIKEIRKEKMRTVERYICDLCNDVILDSKKGFVIHGNIYVANPTELGGLIGNNFPKSIEKSDDVKKTVLCVDCMMQALGVKENVPF